jgi:putative membrane protein
MITNYGLATLNAVLNSAALISVLLGYRAIRDKRIADHKQHMYRAFMISIVFLASYLTRMAMFGDKHFEGQGPIRYVYFAMLITHVLLAVAIAPAVAYTVFLGRRNRIEEHRRIAPKVLPVWLYVLTTGVLVYLFLYHFFTA